MKRKTITMLITVSVDARMSSRAARREVKTRINALVEYGASLDGYYDFADQSSVRVRKVQPMTRDNMFKALM